MLSSTDEIIDKINLYFSNKKVIGYSVEVYGRYVTDEEYINVLIEEKEEFVSFKLNVIVNNEIVSTAPQLINRFDKIKEI